MEWSRGRGISGRGVTGEQKGGQAGPWWGMGGQSGRRACRKVARIMWTGMGGKPLREEKGDWGELQGGKPEGRMGERICSFLFLHKFLMSPSRGRGKVRAQREKGR